MSETSILEKYPTFESYFKVILREQIQDWFTTESEKKTFNENYDKKYNTFFNKYVKPRFTDNDIIGDWKKYTIPAEKELFNDRIQIEVDDFFDNPPVKIVEPIRHQEDDINGVNEKFNNDKREKFKKITRDFFLKKGGILSKIKGFFGKKSKKSQSKIGGTKKRTSKK